MMSALEARTGSSDLDAGITMPDFVNLNDVSLNYDVSESSLALSRTSMSIKRGQFAAVVGPSGCGKSSLMKLVTGLRATTGGTVSVAGKKVTGPLKIVGMAFQNPTLLPWRRLLSNLMLPLEIVQPHRGRLRACPAECIGLCFSHRLGSPPDPRRTRRY